MWDMAKEFLKSVFGWLFEAIAWFAVFIYHLFNELLSFLYGLCGDLFLEAIHQIDRYVPGDLEISIKASFEWLQYIEAWVPVSFAFKLVVAFYGIWLILGLYRTLKSFIPFIGK
ncbi:MAG: hypothetical protein LIQ31_01785 [Planctomycetes bacterium]|nr:hypothetical protein [Planctomycetota bacterium]